MRRIYSTNAMLLKDTLFFWAGIYTLFSAAANQLDFKRSRFLFCLIVFFLDNTDFDFTKFVI